MEDPLNVLDYWSHLEEAVIQLLQIRERHDSFMAGASIETDDEIAEAMDVTFTTFRAESLSVDRLRFLINSRPDALPKLKGVP